MVRTKSYRKQRLCSNSLSSSITAACEHKNTLQFTSESKWTPSPEKTLNSCTRHSPHFSKSSRATSLSGRNCIKASSSRSMHYHIPLTGRWQHLNLLKGSAYRCVVGLKISDAHYTTPLHLLESRFDKVQHVQSSLHSNFSNLLQATEVQSLRRTQEEVERR